MKNNGYIDRLSVHSFGDGNGKDTIFEFLDFGPDSEIPNLGTPASKLIEGGAVVICTEGSVRLMIDSQDYTIAKDDLCVILPFSVIQPLESTDDFRGFALAIEMGSVQRLGLSPIAQHYPTIQAAPCVHMPPASRENLNALFEYMHRIAAEDHPFRKEIADNILNILAHDIVAVYMDCNPSEHHGVSRQEQIFRNFMYSLTRNFKERKGVDFYAREAFLTPRHFSAVIKAKSGKTPIQLIGEKNIAYAKILLSDSPMTIQEISNELHFPNQSFFAKYFKNATGMSPRAFRSSKRA